MTVVLILIAAAIGAAALFFGFLAQRRRKVMATTPTVGCVDVANVAGTDVAVSCEVKGTAGQAKGLVTAPFSNTQCVWYATSVTRRYETYERTSNGTRRVTKEEVVARQSSPQPFAVSDVSGSVWVFPEGAKTSGMAQTVNQFQPRDQGAGAAFGFSLSTLFSGGRSDDGSTIGYEYKENVLREGVMVYVLGGALRDHQGNGWIQRPHQGPYLISTKSEEELARNAGLRMYAGYGVGAAALVTSAALGIAQLIG